MSKIKLENNLEKLNADQVIGFWLTNLDSKDNTHIHTGESRQKAIVIAYDVNECKEDKASRLALVVNEYSEISLQCVDPETKQVTHHKVPPAILNKAIKAMLERIRDDVVE